MRVMLWGTRGSIPSPGPETFRYGGNTPCVQVRLNDDRLIILDAGTGIRRLGIRLLKKKEATRAIILLTHSHWDHIQGFPFFGPAFRNDSHFTLIGPEVAKRKIDRILADQQEAIYFPVNFQDLKATMEFVTLDKNLRYDLGNAQIHGIWTNHTIDCLGYRINEGKRKAVYMPDNELE